MSKELFTLMHFGLAALRDARLIIFAKTTVDRSGADMPNYAPRLTCMPNLKLTSVPKSLL